MRVLFLWASVLVFAGNAFAQAAASGNETGTLARDIDALAQFAGAASVASAPSASSMPSLALSASSKSKPMRRMAQPGEAWAGSLRRSSDPLELKLKSAVALVVDQDTDEVLFQKNVGAVLPIASITKLMTALVTLEAGLPLDEELTVSLADRPGDKMRSRLTPGTKLSRGQAMQLALMASENHAAQLLGRTYPGGLPAFVDAMNARAQLLGMYDSRFADPTGLSPDNRSTPGDLVRLVKAAYQHALIREYSTSHHVTLLLGRRLVNYSNTNGLISNSDWEIGLQKTGFTAASGRCLVMQAVVEGQRVVMILLDSVGRYSRIGDAQRIRKWLVGKKAAHTEQAAQTTEAPLVLRNAQSL